jgi:membrane peptidoglycan carboxypeptidase
MQMVKNVLLAHEKTLSRKLQELFLVWYLEQLLPKQRILEIYFNAIEFGPRLYGIGPAARHYFGKSASDLGPLEAAFFSSILPSPKRRYVQYCAGPSTPSGTSMYVGSWRRRTSGAACPTRSMMRPR